MNLTKKVQAPEWTWLIIVKVLERYIDHGDDNVNLQPYADSVKTMGQLAVAKFGNESMVQLI